MSIDWARYDAKGFFDEMIDSHGRPRALAQGMINHLLELSTEEIRTRQQGNCSNQPCTCREPEY